MPIPILCPTCRRLIRSDEPTCPHCGLLRPGDRWKRSLTASFGLDADSIIKYIIVANAIFFGFSLVLERPQLGFRGNPFDLLSPADTSLLVLGATGTLPINRFHHWWSLVSANYLHGSLLHIVFNMMALRQIGPFVVREFGASRMAVIYTVGGIGGFLLSYLARIPFTIGASAAVCSLIGAALYYGKARGGTYGQAVFQNVWGWALGIFLFGFLVPGINNWGHGGGMATGFLLGMGLGYQERIRETKAHRWLAGACVLLTLGTLAWSVVAGLRYRFGG